MGTWSAAQLAGAVLMAPARLDHLSAVEPVVASGIGGIVLFGTPSGDVRAQLLQLHAAAGAWPLLVASDEEGGGIQRLAALTGALPWPRDLSARGPAGIRAAARDMGRALRALSVRIDLAPVADLDAGPGPDATHPDGKRSFSADPATATVDVLAFAHGLIDAGIVPIVKHYPGLGTASANTDAGTGVTAPLSSLEGHDLAPFVAAVRAGLPALMTSNAIVPGLSSQPVSISPAATVQLRQHLGFRGVIITDSLSAGAISAAGFSVESAAVRALAAGADSVIVGRGDTTDPGSLVHAVRESIVAAVRSGRLPVARLREAVRRLAAMMGTPTC
ncbi:MAG: glycoside hydrolase family 3 protein [Frankiaceae bacterium]|nr:glycoside hydrolase family 3 protein [Frankiaceae bacterium]MBV9369118.1 glycoside hydrolase family 3 protein [Frankiales bacterium]